MSGSNQINFEWNGKLKTMNKGISQSQSPAIILIRPQLGENIGAVARAMLNFGLSDLRIVCPRDGWPNQHAIAVASGAGLIIDNAKLFNSSKEACADLHYIFAATARKRNLSKDTFSPKNAMAKGDNILKSGLSVGIMLGPERSGLQNDDISLSQAIVTVPINPSFPSLNLAQCAVILAYEWFNLSLKNEVLDEFETSVEFASLIEVDHLRLALFEQLTVANYFWPKDKKASLKENLTDLLGRLALTSADVKTLHGVIKALKSSKSND